MPGENTDAPGNRPHYNRLGERQEVLFGLRSDKTLNLQRISGALAQTFP